MKNLMILFGIVMVMAIQTVAQTPDFLFTLRATNALGHKDSAVIGSYNYTGTGGPGWSDPIAGLDGTQLIGTPADSNMELRVKFTPSWSNPYHTNKVIVPQSCPRFAEIIMGYHNQIVILITAKKWPVTLSWDSTLFALDTCKKMSFFSITYTNPDGPGFIDPEYPNPWPLCLAAKHRRLVIDSTFLTHPANGVRWLWPPNSSGANLGGSILLNNGKMGHQHPISLFFNKNLGTRVNNHKPKTSLPIKLYPNPATDQLTIEQPEMGSSFVYLKIYTMQGKTVQQQPLTQGSKNQVIRLSGLKAGMYLVELKNKNGGVSRQKFVKR